ncbi:hypothetical protein O6H91_Y498600 [Diphasiastrum complanatum]|nr:hypothetical protein O6H91_Y498600 [Diphasiastrum complanatum]
MILLQRVLMISDLTHTCRTGFQVCNLCVLQFAVQLNVKFLQRLHIQRTKTKSNQQVQHKTFKSILCIHQTDKTKNKLKARPKRAAEYPFVPQSRRFIFKEVPREKKLDTNYNEILDTEVAQQTPNLGVYLQIQTGDLLKILLSRSNILKELLKYFTY